MTLKRLALSATVAFVCAAAPAEAQAYLYKNEARNQAKGYARHICNDVRGCTGVSNGYDCERLSSRTVECMVDFDFSDGDVCAQAVRVKETRRYYYRKLVYSPDCSVEDY